MKRKRKITQTKTGAIRPLINEHAAGVDIGAREIYAAVKPELDSKPVRCFATFTDELKKLVEWFQVCGIKTVAMEATGVYWIALAELLEDAKIEVCLVNPRHVKNVPGRKTDVQDCQWLQYLHSVGLLRAAFRPPAQVRAIRSLWRHRESLVRQSAWHVQHMHKALDQMNLQIHHVISDITGKSGEAIVKAILAGERDPKVLASLGDKRLKASASILISALIGDYREEHLFCLKQARAGYEFALAQIAEVNEQLETMLKALERNPEAPSVERGSNVDLVGTDKALEQKPEEPPVRQRNQKGTRKRKASNGLPVTYDAAGLLHRHLGVDLTSIPGISTNTAHTLYAELGPDLSAFKSGKHFASWLSLNPDNRISGKKVLSAHIKPSGNQVARALRMAAQGLHHAKNELGDYYRRMKAKLGGAAGLVAVAHKLARIVYAVMTTRMPYEPELHKKSEVKRLARKLDQMRKNAKTMGYDLIAIQQPT